MFCACQGPSLLIALAVWLPHPTAVKVVSFLQRTAHALVYMHHIRCMFEYRTQPHRTLYLAFGHDEEVGGDRGARSMASLLASRGVTIDFVVDEGGPVLIDGLPALLHTDTQIALVGTAEKVWM